MELLERPAYEVVNLNQKFNRQHCGDEAGPREKSFLVKDLGLERISRSKAVC